MNNSNFKNFNSNKEAKKSLSQKDFGFLDFNKKLEEFISDNKTKLTQTEQNIKENKDILNNGNKSLDYIYEKNANDQTKKKDNDYKSFLNLNSNEKIEVKFVKAAYRINFEKFMDCDQFADNYVLEPSMNYDINNNNIDLPYSRAFDDDILLKDESIFFVFDQNYKNHFIEKEDLSKFKKEEIKLNFGKDPYEIYGQILDGKLSPHDKTSIEFYNSLNNFNIFRCRDPDFMNIKMANANNENNDNGDDYFNMINNNNFYNFNYQEQNLENMNYVNSLSTRENSKMTQKNNNIILNEKDFFLNNDFFKKEIDEKEKKGNENIGDKKYIGKKRKNNQ